MQFVWDVTPWRWVNIYRLLKDYNAFIFILELLDPEDQGTAVLQDGRIYLPNDTLLNN